jgi:predicted CoA-binding protein
MSSMRSGNLICQEGEMDLKRLFKPQTMAVIGVSLSNESNPANIIYNKNHLRYQVKAYPVNEKGGLVRVETVYPKISDIPAKIDLAIIATKADIVSSVMAECIESGVGGAVVIRAGSQKPALRTSRTGSYQWQRRLISRSSGQIVSGSSPPPTWIPSSYRARGW